MRTVRLQLRTMQDNPVHWWQPAVRFLVGYGVPVGVVYGTAECVNAINGIGFSRFTWAGVRMLAGLLLLMFGDWLLAFVMRSHLLVFEWVTRTKRVNK